MTQPSLFILQGKQGSYDDLVGYVGNAFGSVRLCCFIIAEKRGHSQSAGNDNVVGICAAGPAFPPKSHGRPCRHERVYATERLAKPYIDVRKQASNRVEQPPLIILLLTLFGTHQ